ncbi:MAG: hypothetical protein M3Z49_06560 [Bifidobacteriales bacterium]|nr:hypothetical protein [Bifidobacteriales bacterium]
MPGTVLESHRHPQHALHQDLALPDGTTLSRLEWEDNYCGLSCIQSILDAKGLPVPILDTLLAEEIESGAHDVAKGWILRGFLNWDVLMDWMVRFSLKHQSVFWKIYP